MTESEAISYIEHYGWSSTRLGLFRTFELLGRLDNPQKNLKYIHVAGSNGKGSVCAMFDAVFRAAGYKTGLYTSPYIQRFNERIRINGEDIPGHRLAELTERVMTVAEEMEDHPSQFELVTAIALEYFRQEACEIVVLEVGLGGALDSTNVIDAPELAVITNIGLEHTEYLGSTLEEIAAAKAGIIKTGCACVCYDGAAEAVQVVRQVSREKDVPFYLADNSQMIPLCSGLEGHSFIWKGSEYRLSLPGVHQLHNAALVLTGIGLLRERGWKISDFAVRGGMETVRWPARMEVMGRDPLFILDGGHNPQCAEALAGNLETLLPGRKVIFLTGVLADKDYGNLMSFMLPHANEFVCVTPDSPRRLQAEDLAAYLRAHGAAATACATIEDGVFEALRRSGGDIPVVTFGSLYLAGAVRSCFARAKKAFQREQCLRSRRKLTSGKRKEASCRICEKLKELPVWAGVRTILSYEATLDEADLTEFHRWAEKQGIRVAFPVSHPHGIMEARIPRDDDAWIIGRFGIRTPDPDRSEPVQPEHLDAVLVPCVGFDSSGGRLGHGGGYYDRFLPRCRRIPKIMTAFDAQRLPFVEQEETDQPIEIIVTEIEIINILIWNIAAVVH